MLLAGGRMDSCYPAARMKLAQCTQMWRRLAGWQGASTQGTGGGGGGGRRGPRPPPLATW